MLSSLLKSPEPARPGPIAGYYPENEDKPSTWSDSIASPFQTLAARVLPYSTSELLEVVREIGSIENVFASMSQDQLEEQLHELKCRMHQSGLQRSLCVKAFALIREFAKRTLNLRPFDTQLMGGWSMLQGRLAEMETGEGKTLTAAITAATVAFAGIPVHVITVNEYLVTRDVESLAPLYTALGLSAGCVTQEMSPDECRKAYGCDITYCTNKQVAFDYLRDRLVLGGSRSQLRLKLESAYGEKGKIQQLMLRGLCFALVDEADSVLIDEARTPLILTRSVDSSKEHAGYREAMSIAATFKKSLHYHVIPNKHAIELDLAGQDKIAAAWSKDTSSIRSLRRCEELVTKALHALHLLCKDLHYLIRDGKIEIIDPNTGRTMPDRSWERGLHQMVEAKHGLPMTDSREQLGRITYQRFFSRYLRLSGMTGTAREVTPELWSVYRLPVQRIPLNRRSRRNRLQTRIYVTAQQKWAAVVDSVEKLHAQGQPVLVGTGSVAESELLSQKLMEAGISHRVLNARHDKEEAQIVAEAGKLHKVTVATNMAGRGTDIKLGKGVDELGGLHVLAACRNDSRRIDRQLAGRCARQGDPGCYQTILSLEDDLIGQNLPPILLQIIKNVQQRNTLLSQNLLLRLVQYAQGRVERRYRAARKAIDISDKRTARLLAFSGPME